MRPALRSGDRLLVDYRRPASPGDVVVARFADGTVAVKRAAERRTTRTGGPGWWLLSDDPDVGVDSRHRGVVAAEHVIAVVRFRVWPLVVPDSTGARVDRGGRGGEPPARR